MGGNPEGLEAIYNSEIRVPLGIGVGVELKKWMMLWRGEWRDYDVITKERKSRYRIWYLMVEKLNFEWKVYGTIACLFDNVLNQKIIKIININWFLIWFELLVFSNVNGLYSRTQRLLENMQSTNTKFHGKKNGREKWY